MGFQRRVDQNGAHHSFIQRGEPVEISERVNSRYFSSKNKHTFHKSVLKRLKNK